MSKAFKERVIYQIYPASFKDSNNDGWGDIQGIISKLDYLKELGIGIIRLSPIYDSPMNDMGYDISDYKKINPRFGTMNDFEMLIQEAKKRDILIVMDLVINHTSTQHEWFKKAISDSNSKYRDYYIIRKGTEKKPPNNWDSCFTGKAWEKLPGSKDEYYLRLYCPTQADLNYKNENVILEVEDILKFRLDKGVYGFRCDVINNIFKTTLQNDSRLKLYNKGVKYYCNQEGMFKILKKFRLEVLDNYDTFLVGETGQINLEIGNKLLEERCLDMFFEFDHIYADKSKLLPVIKRKFSAKRLINPIFKRQTGVPYIANYLENHDQLRSVSRFGDEGVYYNESAKLLAILLLTLKGTPFIFQGEEFGTLNYEFISKDECKDCAALAAFDTVKKVTHLSDRVAWKMVNETLNRDHARAPIAWNDSINGGFNDGFKPWIKINSRYKKINVKSNLEDDNSILNFYKKMIALRNSDEVLKYGEFIKGSVDKKVCCFYRKYQDRTYLILLNFCNKIAKFNTPLKLKMIISNYETLSNKDNKLPPYFGGIYEVI